MNRIAHCQACSNEKHGVKTRISVPHTCGRSFGTAYIKPPLDQAFMFKILGQPGDVGSLRKLIEAYDDNVPFGFRNQPMQTLAYIHFFDGSQFVVFDEI